MVTRDIKWESNNILSCMLQIIRSKCILFPFELINIILFLVTQSSHLSPRGLLNTNTTVLSSCVQTQQNMYLSIYLDLTHILCINNALFSSTLLCPPAKTSLLGILKERNVSRLHLYFSHQIWNKN